MNRILLALVVLAWGIPAAAGPFFHGGTASAPLEAGAKVQVGFSPDAGAEELVLGVIRSAQHSIRLSAYSFTSKPVVTELMAARRRGVDVQCVLDKSNTTSRPGTAAANLLVNAGIPVRIDAMHPIHHNKFIVSDGQDVETGSFNYTASAAHKNAENALVIRNDKALAAEYTRNWQLHWEHSKPYRSTY